MHIYSFTEKLVIYLTRYVVFLLSSRNVARIFEQSVVTIVVILFTAKLQFIFRLRNSIYEAARAARKTTSSTNQRITTAVDAIIVPAFSTDNVHL